MSNQKDLMQEVNKAIQDIISAMLQAMLKGITEQRRLEQEMVMQAYRTVGKEMGHQLAKQLKEQMPEIKVSKLEFSTESGKPSQSLHIVHDQDGKSYQLDQLDEKGRLTFSPVDGKGENLHLDPREVGFSPKVENSLVAATELKLQDPKEALQMMNQAFQQSRVDKKPFMTHFRDQMQAKLQPEIVKARMDHLEKFADRYRMVEFDKLNIEHRLHAIHDQLTLTEGKEELTKVRTELQAEQQSLTGKLEGYDKWLTQTDQRLSRELQTHCPELTDKGLSKLDFYEKYALGQTAFSHTNGLTNEQLRNEMTEKGNEKGLKALDKAEGREHDISESREEVSIEEVSIKEITTEINMDIK